MPDPKENLDEARREPFERFVDQPFEEVFGFKIKFAPDALAPPVDDERIRRYIRKQLPEIERIQVRNLIADYRSWFTAWRMIIWEEVHASS
jgi:hypothetical protein